LCLGFLIQNPSSGKELAWIDKAEQAVLRSEFKWKFPPDYAIETIPRFPYEKPSGLTQL
jgi:hypothetical protein